MGGVDAGFGSGRPELADSGTRHGEGAGSREQAGFAEGSGDFVEGRDALAGRAGDGAGSGRDDCAGVAGRRRSADGDPGRDAAGGAPMDRLRPRIGPRFFKAHGHGNDYLVFEEGDGPVLTGDRVRRICDRRRGVGSDGIVVVEAGGRAGQEARPGTGRGGEGDRRTALAGEAMPVGLRMFNPDGGEFERSGNGLRIAGAWLRRQRRVGDDPFPVRVGGDRIEMQVGAADGAGVRDAAVEMGRADFPDGLPFVVPGAVGRDGRIRLELAAPDGGTRVLRAVAVSIGNPHAVVFGDSWTHPGIVHFGAQIAAHRAFPQGTNVQFAEPPRGRRLRIRIWERGVGHTLSSGTSASAAAVAAMRRGLLAPGRVTVAMEGGAMEVTVSADWRVGLRGPVQDLCTGTLVPGLR